MRAKGQRGERECRRVRRTALFNVMWVCDLTSSVRNEKNSVIKFNLSSVRLSESARVRVCVCV